MGSARGWPVGGGHDRAGSWTRWRYRIAAPTTGSPGRLARPALILLLQCLPLLAVPPCGRRRRSPRSCARRARRLSGVTGLIYGLAGLSLCWGMGYFYAGERERLGCASWRWPARCWSSSATVISSRASVSRAPTPTSPARPGDALDATRLRRAGAAYGVGCLAAGAAAWSRAMSCASESADVIARATTPSSTASNRASPSWMASGLPTMTVSTAGTPSARSGRHTADGGVTIGLGPRAPGPPAARRARRSSGRRRLAGPRRLGRQGGRLAGVVGVIQLSSTPSARSPASWHIRGPSAPTTTGAPSSPRNAISASRTRQLPDPRPPGQHPGSAARSAEPVHARAR